MAESILGLLFEISADPTKAEAALAELKASTVAESADISNVWSSAMNAITGPTGVALGAVVGLGGGLLELANKSAEVGAQLLEVAEKSGISEGALSGLRAESAALGENFDSLGVALSRASANIAHAADTGQGPLAEIIKSSDLLLPVEQRLQVILKRIFDLTDVGQRNMELTALLGRGWQTNLETLKMLADQGYDPMIAKAKELGQFYDEGAAQQAKDFEVAWNNLKLTLSGVADTIGRELTPAFTSLFKSIAGEIGPLGELRSNLDQLEGDIKKYGVAVDESGRIWTKADLEQRKAKQSQDDFHPTLARTTDDLKAQVAAINQSTKGLAEFNVNLKETKKAAEPAADSTEKHAKSTEHLDRAATAAEIKLAGFAETVRQIRLFFSAPDFSHGITTTLPAVVKAVVDLKLPLDAAAVSFKSLDQIVPDFAKNMSFVPLALGKDITVLQQMKQAVDQLKQSLQSIAQDQSGGGMLGVLDNLKQGFQEMANAVGQAAANALVYGSNFDQAMKQALKSTLASLSAQAFSRAIFEAASALASLAVGDFADAALHAESAALFGAIGYGEGALGGSIGAAGLGGMAGSVGAGASGPGRGVQTGQLSGRSTSVAFGGGGPQVAIYVDGIISADTMAQAIPQIIGGIQQGINNGIPLRVTGTINRPVTTAGR